MGEPVNITLNPLQYRLLQNASHENFFIAGIGGGKTFALGLTLYRALSTPGTICALLAPTHGLLNTATLPQVNDCWRKLGFMQDVHYVINRQPPATWKVQPYSPKSASNILTTRWGSYCLVGSMDNPNSIRGIEADEIFVDEFRDMKQKQVRDVLLGRLRGKAYKKLGKDYRIWYVTTPPDNPTYLKDSLAAGRANFIQGSTLENIKNLPVGYVDHLRSSYDALTYQREVLGELVADQSGTFAYAYSEDEHITSTPGREMADPSRPIVISFDFNVDPAVCLFFQHDRHRIRVLGEVYLRNADIYQLTDAIQARWPEASFRVTGDSSGNARNMATKGNLALYTIIKRELNISLKGMEVPKANPSIRDTRVLLNSMLQNGDILISSECRNLIRDLELVQYDPEAAQIVKEDDPLLTHLLDAFRYYLWTYHRKFIRTSRDLATRS